MSNISIFVVEDDPIYGSVLAHYLSLNPDFQVKRFETGQSFLAAAKEQPDIITLDYNLPDENGDELLEKIKVRCPRAKVFMISGQDDVQVAINLMKNGVEDYLVKDANTNEKLWLGIQKIAGNIQLQKQLQLLQKEVVKKYSFESNMIGKSAALKYVFALMEKATTTNINVLVSGETGTGKELVAKSIHFNSNRKHQPFVAVNVSAIPSELIESELFGHEKGAFTGAAARRIGRFEEAQGGTIFLDEIAEMDVNLQAKLLRVLQEKEFTRVGGNELVKVDVRIIAATHKNLAEEVSKKKFREDLYYRLLGLPIHLPPLRERGNDVVVIAMHLIEQFCAENGMPVKTLSTSAKKKLLMHAFPGNVRQLKALVELAAIMSDTDEIQDHHLQEMQIGTGALGVPIAGENLTLRQYTIKLVQHYLNINNFDVMEVARKLDIGKSTIYRMINNNELVMYTN